MHESRRQFADRLYAESHAHDQDRPRLERFRSVEPPTAELLGVLIEFTERIGAVAEVTQTVVPVGAGLRVAVGDRS
jgi:hypothetical protein